MSVNVIIPSSESDQKEIRNMISTICDSYTRIDAEKEAIKEIIAEISEKYEIPKKYVSKISKIFYKASLSEVQQENEDVVALYETILED